MTRLFIAEKPDLAKAIAEGLGGGSRRQGYIECGSDIVTWCFGHMLQLCDPHDYDAKYKTWNMDDLPIINIPWKYKVSPDKKDQVKIILDLIKFADVIVNAGDPDEEGQLLVDELLDYCGNKKPVKRVLINDLTLPLVKKALDNLKDNKEFFGLSQSALARSVADQMYGYNMTRAYTLAGQVKGYESTLNIGRVKTPVMGLVIERQRQHEAHQVNYFFTLKAQFAFDDLKISANYKPGENIKTDEKGRAQDQNQIQEVATACKGQTAIAEKVETEIKQVSQPLPYNLLNLQADASKKFGYKPDRVKEITQTLRESYKLITYNRSDCQYLSEEQHESAPAVLAAISKTAPSLAVQIKQTDSSIKSRAFNSENVSAHHAIIPTEATADFSKLTNEEQNIYLMIARAYVVQFFPKKEVQETLIQISCAGHSFSVTNKKTISPGWELLYLDSNDNEEGEGEEDSISLDLKSLSSGNSGTCIEAKPEKKETKPLALYTMSALLKDLTRAAKYISDPKIKKILVDRDKDKKGEHGGIGTPATRDTIIKELFDKNFLVEKGKNIIGSELGHKLFDVLPDKVRRPDMTALWADQQQQIQEGRLTVSIFLDGLVKFLDQEVQTLKTEGLNIKIDLGPECPTCKQSHLKRRKGSNGFFWGCRAYPECKASFPDKKGKPDLEPPKTYPCPKCGKDLRQINGPSGKFWGCKGFPECKASFPDKKDKPDTAPSKAAAVHKCPACGLQLRQVNGKYGLFWSCFNKPKCSKNYKDVKGKPDLK